MPLFYKPIIDTQLKPDERLDPTCVSDATSKCQFLKDAFSQYKMKKGEGYAAWYKPLGRDPWGPERCPSGLSKIPINLVRCQRALEDQPGFFFLLWDDNSSNGYFEGSRFADHSFLASGS